MDARQAVTARTVCYIVEPRALTARQAAAYVGVSRSHFYHYIKPNLRVVDLKAPTSTKPMWRWLREDLDHYLLPRRNPIP